jgi:nucleotide-binding universal stress UspA family protein
LDTGRPVLLVSQQLTRDFAKIAVAWNGSTASAHAVSAALPFLERASEVEILVVKRQGAETIATDDVQTYLRLHGVTSTARHVEGSGRPVADVLLDAAAQGSAGMLVAGGYGHNRLRELFVTGTTRRVVARAALPCFLVH